MTAKKTTHHIRASSNLPISLSFTHTPPWRVPVNSLERAKFLISYSSMLVVNRPAFVEIMYEELKT